MVRASPSLFHRLGSFAGVRSSMRVRLLGIGSAFRNRFGSVFSYGLHRHRHRRRRRLHFSRLAAPNSTYQLHFT